MPEFLTALVIEIGKLSLDVAKGSLLSKWKEKQIIPNAIKRTAVRLSSIRDVEVSLKEWTDSSKFRLLFIKVREGDTKSISKDEIINGFLKASNFSKIVPSLTRDYAEHIVEDFLKNLKEEIYKHETMGRVALGKQLEGFRHETTEGLNEIQAELRTFLDSKSDTEVTNVVKRILENDLQEIQDDLDKNLSRTAEKKLLEKINLLEKIIEEQDWSVKPFKDPLQNLKLKLMTTLTWQGREDEARKIWDEVKSLGEFDSKRIGQALNVFIFAWTLKRI